MSTAETPTLVVKVDQNSVRVCITRPTKQLDDLPYDAVVGELEMWLDRLVKNIVRKDYWRERCEPFDSFSVVLETTQCEGRPDYLTHDVEVGPGQVSWIAEVEFPITRENGVVRCVYNVRPWDGC